MSLFAERTARALACTNRRHRDSRHLLHGFGSWIPKPQPQNREDHEPPTRPTNSQLPCIDRTACYRLKPEPDADIPICRYAAKAQARSGPGARYGAVTESSAPPPGQVLIDLSRQNPWDGSWDRALGLEDQQTCRGRTQGTTEEIRTEALRRGRWVHSAKHAAGFGFRALTLYPMVRGTGKKKGESGKKRALMMVCCQFHLEGQSLHGFPFPLILSQHGFTAV